MVINASNCADLSAFHSVCSTCSLLSEEEDEASTEELEVDV
ncbi:hypothetical protein CUZ94_2150 [Enterococcus faecium]|nr:hypothetical protein [Enterococcus faecium]MBK4865096.1 hypothetical protein [Enterococcus faecium]MBK4878598.1 hypothetical protein [Enterococcus faecium]